jgi:hypothetical protein
MFIYFHDIRTSFRQFYETTPVPSACLLNIYWCDEMLKVIINPRSPSILLCFLHLIILPIYPAHLSPLTDLLRAYCCSVRVCCTDYFTSLVRAVSTHLSSEETSPLRKMSSAINKPSLDRPLDSGAEGKYSINPVYLQITAKAQNTELSLAAYTFYYVWPVRSCIMDFLNATQSSCLFHALGITPRPGEKKKYLHPLRDLPLVQPWCKEMIAKGYRVFLLGKDVPTLLKRIEQPELARLDPERHPLFIWVAVVDTTAFGDDTKIPWIEPPSTIGPLKHLAGGYDDGSEWVITDGDTIRYIFYRAAPIPSYPGDVWQKDYVAFCDHRLSIPEVTGFDIGDGQAPLILTIRMVDVAKELPWQPWNALSRNSYGSSNNTRRWSRGPEWLEIRHLIPHHRKPPLLRIFHIPFDPDKHTCDSRWRRIEEGGDEPTVFLAATRVR